MKRKTLTLIFTGLITLILTTLTMNAFLRKDKSQATDEQGHVLAGLWADWNKAVQQDRPKLQEEILAQIRDRAMDQRLAWDFYDASTRYVDAVTDRNWKLADSLAAEFADNVRKFDEPIVTFTWMGRRGGDSPLAILKYVQDHAKSLKSSRNDAFYRVGLSRYGGLGATLAPFLPEFYANDYEYALWQLLPFTSYPNVNEGEIYAALKDYERDSYPLGVYLEYLEAAFLIKVVNRIDQNAKKMQRVTSMKIYLTNPTLRCALYTPISENDDACGEMVETAIYDQWILGEKTSFYYANWNKGRDKGEIDIVWVDAATQKAFSLAEIKWTDKFFEDSSQLKSLRKFLAANDGIRKIIVTTKSKRGKAIVDDNTFLFIPSALYAYWVSRYLFEEKANQILLPERDA